MTGYLKILCAITNRGDGDKIVKELGKNVNFVHMLRGHGTANSEVLALLGIGEAEKDVIVCAVSHDKLDDVLKTLSWKFNFGGVGKGIAFTVPIESAGGMVALQILSGRLLKQEK
ncbi:MAG: hypothetical protein NC350_02390 [Corallococcus sp.]|nr:hypothetical protein [Corallococcus sp.]